MRSIKEIKYSEMLEKLYSKLPRRVEKKAERFEMPKVEIIHVGNSTIIRNFREIADYLRRDERHLMRYLLSELGVAGRIGEAGELIVNARFSAHPINVLLQRYVKYYVICPTCGSWDTKLEKLPGKIYVLKCEACGAEQTLKPMERR